MSTSHPPTTSVIIPNWNGAHLLPDCLDALRQQTLGPTETLVVDNASVDASRDLLAQHYSEVRLVPLAENRYFAGAVNEGIRRSTGEIVVLLNNDTEAAPGWLAALVAGLKACPQAGMAASKLLLFDRRDVLHSAGDGYRRDGVPCNRGVWQPDRGQFDRRELVFGACGGAAAYRRTMLEAVGLLDETFVAYCEDVDLNWRAQLAGYRCVYVPEAVVYHRLSATGGGPLASFYCGRNFLFLLAKDVPGPLLRRHWARILLAQIGYTLRSLVHWRERAARAWLRGQWAGLLGLPAMLRRRAAVQASRRVDLAYLESLLAG
ncbi:MAG: glycosyltransferase family 2 protein [Chloroflexi bacterium]|nr:glycosyltransferase family 2 protein [Chloroflexota bacterium]